MNNKVFAKADNNKPTFELLPLELLAEVNEVFHHGAKKYGVNNWKKTEGFKMSRCYNALLRHMIAWWNGENLDKESGISHLSHAMCNLIFLMYHLKEGNGDDRPIFIAGGKEHVKMPAMLQQKNIKDRSGKK